MTKLYRVRCVHQNIETFLIRAEDRESAKDEADNLVTGKNLSRYDASAEEVEDSGQEADND